MATLGDWPKIRCLDVDAHQSDATRKKKLSFYFQIAVESGRDQKGNGFLRSVGIIVFFQEYIELIPLCNNIGLFRFCYSLFKITRYIFEITFVPSWSTKYKKK